MCGEVGGGGWGGVHLSYSQGRRAPLPKFGLVYNNIYVTMHFGEGEYYLKRLRVSTRLVARQRYVEIKIE